MFNKQLTLFVILCSFQFLFAQERPQDEVGAWYILATNNTVTDKISIQAQTQFRFYEMASEIEQFKIRVGGTYRFSDQLSASLGYSYFRTDPSYAQEDPAKFNEHRIYEDIHLRNSIGKVGILHRYRAEHRFFDFENGSDTRHWMRYMLKLTYPLTERVSIDVYDEVFVNLEEPLFGQNWLGGGVTYQLSTNLKTRVGYQKIHLDGPDFDRLIFGITFNTDFRNDETTTP